MSPFGAEHSLRPDTHAIAEAAIAASARAGWMQAPPDAEASRQALVITAQQLHAARQQIDELQGQGALLRRQLALLEHEVTKAHRFAYRDELTRLPNRRLLLDRFTQVVARGIRRNQRVALLFIDLDGFKQINDEFGHVVGDRVLEQVGERLTGCIRASDKACRFGGDEFIVLLPEIQEHEQAVVVMTKIRARLAVPYAVGCSTITNTASIGMAVFPIDGCALDELIRAADRDMYSDKTRGSVSALTSAGCG